VLAGIATSGVVLGKVFPRQAEVTTIADRADRLHHAASSLAQPPGQRALARCREAI